MLVSAAIYAILAWRVSRRSLIALILALLLYVADTVFTILEIGRGGGGAIAPIRINAGRSAVAAATAD